MSLETAQLFRFPGEVTIENLVRFKQEYSSKLGGSEKVKIDLSDVSIINSAFIGGLINLRRDLGESCDIVLFNEPSNCRRLIKICKLDSFILFE